VPFFSVDRPTLRKGSRAKTPLDTRRGVPGFRKLRNCDAGVTQNLPTLPKLTSLTILAAPNSITYVAATRPGEFGLQVRLPQNSLARSRPPLRISGAAFRSRSAPNLQIRLFLNSSGSSPFRAPGKPLPAPDGRDQPVSHCLQQLRNLGLKHLDTKPKGVETMGSPSLVSAVVS
jgi:hypothetical protein